MNYVAIGIIEIVLGVWFIGLGVIALTVMR
jgi:hypothetical protein